jgi:Delta3-Delta2-enoyl-CoA isomerase
MPTVALINGHAFAGGLMTAMMQDYRIMNPHRGFLCVNELEFGAPLPGPMASIFRQKIPSPNTYRTMVLEAKRYNALEALKEGIVDGLGGLDEVLMFVDEMKLRAKGKSGVYGRLKAEMWRETVGFLSSGGTGDDVARALKEWKLQEEGQRWRVEEWERGAQKDPKSKL